MSDSLFTKDKYMHVPLFQQIAKEMRDFAGSAYGSPPTVQITQKTLREWADALDGFKFVVTVGEGGGGPSDAKTSKTPKSS